MVGMDSHFYEHTSPLNGSFEVINSKATSHIPKCISPALQHVTHGSDQGIPTDLNSPELTFDHMSIQQFIRSNELNNNNNSHSNNNHGNSNNSSNSNPNNHTNNNRNLENSVSIFPALINAADKNSAAESGRIPLVTHHSLHSVQQAASAAPVSSTANSSLQQQQQQAGGTSHSSHYSTSYQHHPQMPQQPSLGTDRYGLEASSSVKQEPSEAEDFSTSCSQNSVYSGSFSTAPYGSDTRIANTATTNADPSMLRRMHFMDSTSTTSSQMRNSQSNRGGSGKHSSKKHVDKGSDEYKKRRERNNIAVRKSREKAKIRSRETEKRVTELSRENEQLRKKVDSLCKELHLLKNLLTTVGGVPPENVDSEIEKGLQSGFGSM